MRTATLNGLVRSVLRQQSKPIHYYSRFIKYASDCLRELIFDTLQITNTVRLPIDSLYEAEIPADYVDKIMLGIQNGQHITPLVEKKSLNRLANRSDDGTQILYPSTDITDETAGTFQWWGTGENTNGENIGGYFGLGAGSEPDTYIIIPERNVIKLNQNVANNTVVLQYISDGGFSNAATQIPVYAIKTIEAYINWQYKENSKSFSQYDAERAKRLFDRQHEILRARKNDLTPELLQRIINRSRKASLK